MRPTHIKGAAAFAGLGIAISLAGCTTNNNDDGSSASAEAMTYTTRDVTDGTTEFTIVTNPNGGQQLSYSTEGGMSLVEEQSDGYTYAFKDMNKNGELDGYEDWRLDPAERAADLAADLSAEQISGLMLFSNHESSAGDGLTDAQKTYLSDSNLRNILNASSSDVTDNVTWSNQVQAYVESLATADSPYVPANFSSDPRNEATAADAGTAGEISKWPSNLGLAATFSPETAELYGRYLTEEYRALGITNALSPQIDLATDPRWLRDSGTFGEDVTLASELAAALVTGYQSTYDADGNNLGWGMGSVATMIKHAPGDGAGEGGRESHTDAGKYAIPGDNVSDSLQVFAAASDSIGMMTDYSILLNPDGTSLGGGDLVGTAYDPETMAQIRAQFDGVIVTDWAVMNSASDEGGGWQGMDFGTAWGTEGWDPVDRYVTVLENGVDQFGGVNDSTLILEAYDAWDAKYAAGDEDVDAATRWAESGTRILTGFFSTGVFDSPFVDLDEATAVVGSQDKVDAGYQAQLDSVVMLKNDDTISEATLEDWADKTAYIPWTYDYGHASIFGGAQYTDSATLTIEVAQKYFANVVTDTVEYDENGVITSITAPDMTDVDVALVGMKSPSAGAVFENSGYDAETDSYYPMSLQYRPYTADGDNVRQVSIGGDILADGTKQNRSYFGNTSKVTNEADLDAFERAVAAADASGKDIPVIALLKASNPVVPTEFEADADAILVGFGVSDQALIETALGLSEPQGRLPIGFPASMDAVEASDEGVAKDVESFVDENGNSWAFGYGLNWSGVIAG
ncbi:glycoside hydrolase family 3 N-terminal domain-containing protein [Demequina capsici]|uniref:beta-glucosidase n=1 Tax=Demequina capsici TaxID=3075620 RepID=A0AA96F9F7_9MICO|nr:glycoside hydrolase family 3 N-terminal domain-containing protein [Demequina sp. OYTSA14]WNM25165.1 glycoside hydrolase family 3 N-terminal domain-containing protein [Demequina sp. OYTSA14]